MKAQAVVCLLACVLSTQAASLGGWYDNVQQEGCRRGYWGEKCQAMCDSETCVQQPHHTAPDEVGILCDKLTGVAIECDKCAPKFFGHACEEDCPQTNCDTEQPYTCDKIDGSNLQCDNCLAGFTGKDCNLIVACPPIRYPDGGKSNCSNTESSPYNTNCAFACNEGYTLKGHDTTTCKGNPPVEPVGFSGEPRVADLHFLSGSKGWTAEDVCLYLGHGSSLGGSRYDSKLADKVIGPDGKVMELDPPMIVVYFTHLECAGVAPIKCMVPDLGSACTDQQSCLEIEHFLDTCSECYSKQPDRYIRDDAGDFVVVEGARKANCTAKNGDSAPSWFVCNRFFDKWCASFPTSKYCERTSTDTFFAPNPCAGKDCTLRGTCNQHTGKCDCQWAYTGENCEKDIMTTSGHWTQATPICEANPCVAKKLRHQHDECVGLVGDVCIPKPDAGYVCRGQLECMPDGAFRGEATCTPVEKCGQACHALAACVDGKCECSTGYWGDGVEKCAAWDVCSGGKVEIVSPSSTNNRVCGDVNECETFNGGCEQLCYNLDGSFECACMEGWMKNDDSKTCKRRQCESLILQNGAAPCTGVFEDKCVPSCRDGFESVGHLVCEGSGQFVGDGRCRGVLCEDFLIDNGDDERPCRGATGDVCIPTCRNGYTSQGYLTCSPPHFEGNARCIPNECPPLAIVNALELCEGRTGESCKQVRCAPGFYFRGSAVCEADGTWNGFAVCDNINECSANFGKGPCAHTCTDTYGGYECSCMLGYVLGSDGVNCVPNACPDTKSAKWSNTCSGVLGDTCTPVGTPGYSCFGTLSCKRQIGSVQPMWEGSSQCNAIGCEKKFMHGAKTPCIGVTGDSCVPIPASGYQCSGIDVCNGRTSLFEGNATCTGMKCPVKMITHGDICGEGEVGDICNDFFCDNGYLPVGTFSCVYDEAQGAGIWVGGGHCKAALGCDPYKHTGCGDNATCIASGVFGGICQCTEGFWGDGQTCKPHSSECAPGTRLLQNSGTSTQDVQCVDVDECSSGTPCDPKHGVCMNTAGSFVCGCLAGYQISPENPAKCIPSNCQPRTVKGAKECSGAVGDVCEVSKLSLDGYSCIGHLDCDGTTLNFVGNATCVALACHITSEEHSTNTCTGIEGDTCQLMCEYGYKETGIKECHNQEWSNHTCKAVSVSHCAKFGFSISSSGTCGDKDGVLGCLQDLTHQQAEEHCRGEGARLCTVDEIKSGVIKAGADSACENLNQMHIWSNTRCSEDSFYAQAASPELADYEHAKLECRKASTMASVKCCADELPAPVIDICTTAFNYGGCDDRCYNDLTDPKGYFCTCEKPFHSLASDGRGCNLVCPPMMAATPNGQAPYCVPRAGLTGQKYLTFGSATLAPLQVGKYSWQSPMNGECRRVNFLSTFPTDSVVQIQVTPSRNHTQDSPSARPFVVWVERVNNTGFVACFHETSKHLPIKERTPQLVLNWMAYTELPSPAQASEISLARFANAYTQYTHVSMAPHILDVSEDNLHVQITVNHRHGGVSDPIGIRGDQTKHNPITAWLERTNYHSFMVGVEETGMTREAWYHAEHANADYLVFKPWANMNAEGVFAGVVNMALAQPARAKSVKSTENPSGAILFESGAHSGLCQSVAFPTKLDTIPAVFLTLDHRDDARGMAHPDYHSKHNGATVWAETVSNKGMLVCYKDLSRYRQEHGKSVFVDWVVIA